MPVEWVALVAALVTTTLLGFAGAIAIAGLQVAIDWRSPRRSAAAASLLQHLGTMLALLGLVYRHQGLGTIGLLLVILSVLTADFRRDCTAPRLEVGLTVLALANLVAVTLLLIA